jgi:signal transduction histidine kinase
VRARRLGLTSMNERAASLGGSLTITSALGQGTTVELRVPR